LEPASERGGQSVESQAKVVSTAETFEGNGFDQVVGVGNKLSEVPGAQSAHPTHTNHHMHTESPLQEHINFTVWIKVVSHPVAASSLPHCCHDQVTQRADFRALELGEVAPEKRTVTEPRIRLAELKEEKGLTGKRSKRTILQEWVVKLNAASKKKMELQKFNHEQLNLSVAGNATILDLQKQAMEKIYQISPAHGTDPVGFGQHGALSYEEVMQQGKNYCKWVITTAKEGQCSSRCNVSQAGWSARQPRTW